MKLRLVCVVADFSECACDETEQVFERVKAHRPVLCQVLDPVLESPSLD